MQLLRFHLPVLVTGKNWTRWMLFLSGLIFAILAFDCFVAGKRSGAEALVRVDLNRHKQVGDAVWTRMAAGTYGSGPPPPPFEEAQCKAVIYPILDKIEGEAKDARPKAERWYNLIRRHIEIVTNRVDPAMLSIRVHGFDTRKNVEVANLIARSYQEYSDAKGSHVLPKEVGIVKIVKDAQAQWKPISLTSRSLGVGGLLILSCLSLLLSISKLSNKRDALLSITE